MSFFPCCFTHKLLRRFVSALQVQGTNKNKQQTAHLIGLQLLATTKLIEPRRFGQSPPRLFIHVDGLFINQPYASIVSKVVQKKCQQQQQQQPRNQAAPKTYNLISRQDIIIIP